MSSEWLNLAKKAKIIYEKFPESEDIALQYAMVLVNLSVEQDNVEDLLKTSKAAKQIFDRFWKFLINYFCFFC